MNPVILQALDIMWKGMLGIFLTILIIMVCVFIMGKIGSKGQEKDESKTHSSNA